MQYRESAVSTGPVVVALNRSLMGLEPDTGAIRWSHLLDGGVTIRLAITEQCVYAATDAKVYCFDYLSGEQHWEVKRIHFGAAAILVHGDRILVASAGYMECLSLSGAHLWKNGFRGKGFGSCAIGVPGDVVQADRRN